MVAVLVVELFSKSCFVELVVTGEASERHS
jgi:hypothetical protein